MRENIHSNIGENYYVFQLEITNLVEFKCLIILGPDPDGVRSLYRAGWIKNNIEGRLVHRQTQVIQVDDRCRVCAFKRHVHRTVEVEWWLSGIYIWLEL